MDVRFELGGGAGPSKLRVCLGTLCMYYTYRYGGQEISEYMRGCQNYGLCLG